MLARGPRMSLVPPAIRRPRRTTIAEPSPVDAWLELALRVLYAIAALLERPELPNK